jgi:hypothetical protein
VKTVSQRERDIARPAMRLRLLLLITSVRWQFPAKCC